MPWITLLFAEIPDTIIVGSLTSSLLLSWLIRVDWPEKGGTLACRLSVLTAATVRLPRSIWYARVSAGSCKFSGLSKYWRGSDASLAKIYSAQNSLDWESANAVPRHNLSHKVEKTCANTCPSRFYWQYCRDETRNKWGEIKTQIEKSEMKWCYSTHP